ncbi:MAG: Na(+)-translocating NADH-quinone reductase subunit A [Vicinamibacterales bacterium]
MTHRATRGLQIPLAGQPAAQLEDGPPVRHVALLAADYVGLRPTFQVQVGDHVRRGDVLFEDKMTAGVRYTAPAEGTVTAIHRGARRAFQSVVIELSDAERQGHGAQAPFESFSGRAPSSLTGDEVRALLLESGLWTALRGRPFSRVADPAKAPRSIFVTAMDSEPLAPPIDLALPGRTADLERGLAVLTRLTTGPVFFCTDDTLQLPLTLPDRVRHERFAGPHPAGTVGFHIHRLDPAGRDRLVWHVDCRDVAAMGRLFASGELDTSRIVGLGGPAAAGPRLIRTRLGASVDELIAGEHQGEIRVLSGSALSGRAAAGPVEGFLGRYHRQICLLPEGRDREFMGWAAPGGAKYSSIGIFLGRYLGRKPLRLTTSTNGSRRAIVPIGMYERVMPFDMEPTYLLKALLTKDLERAEQLGCLELDEEALALCTFVCPGKHENGPYLRDVLTANEKED